MSKWVAEFELEDGDTMPEHMDLEYKGARIDFHCKPLEQEPKKGHWRPVYQGDEIIDYRCSECEFGNTFGKGTVGMNFCPHCGADMREVDYDS